jgi:Peptidase M50B-like
MGGSPLGTELARIGQLQTHLPGPLAVLLGIVAVGAAALPDVWLLTRHVYTIAHEGAHATVGSVMGRQVTGVKMFRDGSGNTSVQPGQRSGDVMFLASGYLGPSAFGVGAAKLIELGHIVAVLWLSLILLLLMLLVARSSFAIISVLITGAAVYVVAAYTAVGAQVMVAYVITWFLLLSGVRMVREHGTGARDADELRNLTSIPKGFWSFLWFVGSIAALGFGGYLLV